MKRLWWIVRLLPLRRLRERPLRETLSALAVALGVALFVSSELNTAAILEAVTGVRSAIDTGADLVVSRGSAAIEEADVEALRARPEIGWAAGVLEVPARLRTGTPMVLLGVEPQAAALRQAAAQGMHLTDSDPVAALLRRNALFLTRGTAAALALRVGDGLTLITAQGERAFTLAGLLAAPERVEAALGSFAFMALPHAQALLSRQGQVDRVQLGIASGAARPDVEAAVAAVLGPGAAVQSPADRAAEAGTALDMFRAVFLLNDLLALLIAAFFVFNSAAAAAAERTREAGLLRAIGLTGRGLLGLALAEAALLALLAVAAGVPLGGLLSALTRDLLARVVENVNFPVPPLAARMPGPALILQAGALALGTTLVATLAATWRASRRPPLDLLHSIEGAAHAERGLRRAACFAVVLLSAALVLVPLLPPRHDLAGVVLVALLAPAAGVLAAPPLAAMGLVALRRTALGRAWPALLLACDALRLHPVRTAMASGALALALALVVSHGGIVLGMDRSVRGWLEDSIPGDVILAGHPTHPLLGMPFDEAAVAPMRGLPGVADVFRARFRTTRIRGMEVGLAVLEMDVASRRARHAFVSGDPETAYPRVIAGDAVFVSENLARRHALEVEGEVVVAAPEGPVALPIAGVLHDYGHPAGSVIMDLRLYRALYHDPLVDYFELCVTPGADLVAVQAEAKRHAAEGAALLGVFTRQELLDEALAFLRDLRRLSMAQVVLAVAIGASGVFTTLLLSVIGRRRELALAAAVGMDRRMLHRTVVLEVVLLAGSAAAVGLVLGHLLWMPANLVFRAFSGFTFAHAWPWFESLLAVGGAAVTAWLAAKAGMRRLTRATARALDE